MHIVGFDLWSFVFGVVVGNVMLFAFACALAAWNKRGGKK